MTPDTTRNPTIYFRNQLPVLSWFLLYHVLGGSINPFFNISILSDEVMFERTPFTTVHTASMSNGCVYHEISQLWLDFTENSEKKKTDELQVLENVTVSFAWTSLYQSFCY